MARNEVRPVEGCGCSLLEPGCISNETQMCEGLQRELGEALSWAARHLGREDILEQLAEMLKTAKKFSPTPDEAKAGAWRALMAVYATEAEAPAKVLPDKRVWWSRLLWAGLAAVVSIRSRGAEHLLPTGRQPETTAADLQHPDDAAALWESVYWGLRKRGAHHEEAENGAQHAALKLCGARKTGRPIPHLLGWLVKVGWNYILKERLRCKKRTEREQSVARLHRESIPDVLSEVAVLELFEDVLARLPVEHLDAFWRWQRDESVEDIAKEFGCTPANIRLWVRSLEKSLREGLGLEP